MMDLQRVNAYMERVEQSEKKTFQPVGSKLKVGLDLGTAYIVLVVLDEEDNPIACEKQAASVLKDGDSGRLYRRTANCTCSERKARNEARHRIAVLCHCYAGRYGR